MENINDDTALTDSILVEVKGPGKQWAWRDRHFEMQAELEAKDVEEVDYKGPGPEWDTNEEGVYINRDEDE